MVPLIGPLAGIFLSAGTRRRDVGVVSSRGIDSNAPAAIRPKNGLACLTYFGWGIGFLPGLLYIVTLLCTGIGRQLAALQIASPASFPNISPMFCDIQHLNVSNTSSTVLAVIVQAAALLVNPKQDLDSGTPPAPQTGQQPAHHFRR